MNPQSTHDFIARGEIVRDNTSIPVTITGNYPALGPDPVQCTVVPEMENLPAGVGDPLDQTTIQLTGRTEQGTQLWIPDFRVRGATHSHGQLSWKGIAELFVEGTLEEFDGSGGKIVCSAFVPPTPALVNVAYHRSYDGTITLREGEERKGVRWETRLGEAELIDNYEYLDEQVGLHKALVRVQRSQITVTIRPSGVVSLRSILSDLGDALDDSLWLLSFLCRKRIAWYGARAMFLPGDSPTRDIRMAIARRRQWLGYESLIQTVAPWVDVLVKPQALQEGLFQQLLDNYEISPVKNTISRTIGFLLLSHERAYFEAHLGGVYLALETLVDGLSEESEDTYLLGSSRFKRLTRVLKQTIRDEIEDPDTAKGLIKKLPELRRRAFLDRLLTLLEEYNIDGEKLQFLSSDVPSMLHEALRRRHRFIHQGRLDNVNYVRDLYHLQNLVELWILKLLDCPDTAINSHALRSPVPINRE